MFDLQKVTTNDNCVYWLLTRGGDFYNSPIVLKENDIVILLQQIQNQDPELNNKIVGKSILWYFAHPYSAKTREEEIVNFDLCNRRVSTLMDNGYRIFSPITHSHNVHSVKMRDHNYWLNLDEMFMSRCNGAIFAPNWDKSEGCKYEHRWFKDNNKPVLYYAELCKKFAKQD